MEYVIEVEEVVKDYGDFKLDNISFQVEKGCICGFVGQNGSGKTTTIQLLMDVIKKDSGLIKIFGQNVVNNIDFKKDVGIVFDEMGFHEFMTPMEISKMMSYIYVNWDEDKFLELIKRLGLPTKKKCGTFSRGMRMKLQIAVAMSHHAKLLILDEPTSGLDPIVRNEILTLFQEYIVDEEHTILLSSHITSDLERIADHIVFINAGKIVLSGAKDIILEEHGILRCKKSELDKIDKEDIVSTMRSSVCVEVLVSDRKLCEKKYKENPIDTASLDEIMLFYVNKRSEIE